MRPAELRAVKRHEEAVAIALILVHAEPVETRIETEAIRIAQAARDDLVAKESAEVAVLQSYLPSRLSADEVQSAVAELVAELGAKGPGDMGRVMAVAKSRLGASAEMAQVSAAVKAALSR